MDKFLNAAYFGNPIKDWLMALFILLAGILLALLFKKRVLQLLKGWASKSSTTLDDFLLATIEKSVIPLFYLGAFSLALNALVIPTGTASVIHVAILLFTTFFVLRMFTSIARQFVFSFIKNEESNEIKEKQARGLLVIVNIVFWILGVVFKVKQIPAIVKNIIECKEDVRLDRGYFSAFGDFSLDFEFVYYILSPDYNVSMDKQQEIYFDISNEI